MIPEKLKFWFKKFHNLLRRRTPSRVDSVALNPAPPTGPRSRRIDVAPVAPNGDPPKELATDRTVSAHRGEGLSSPREHNEPSICQRCAGKKLIGCTGCIAAACSWDCDGTELCSHCDGNGEVECESCDEGAEVQISFMFNDEGEATWEWGGESEEFSEESSCSACGGNWQQTCPQCHGEEVVACSECEPCTTQGCAVRSVALCPDCAGHTDTIEMSW